VGRPVRPFFRPLDLLVLVLLAAAALFPLLRRDTGEAGSTVVISDGKGIIACLPLAVDRTLRVPGPLGETVVEIKGGVARVLTSPCPERACILSGGLSRPGQSAICLPNLVAVTVRGNPAPDDLDAISR
jgi:hypothetical protein